MLSEIDESYEGKAWIVQVFRPYGGIPSIMIQQENVFANLAMGKALELLQQSVFTGELYEGELLEKISELDTAFLRSYADELKSVLGNYMEKCIVHTWSYDGEEEEFKEMVNSLLAKLERCSNKC
jgi:hypothetical protein